MAVSDIAFASEIEDAMLYFVFKLYGVPVQS